MIGSILGQSGSGKSTIGGALAAVFEIVRGQLRKMASLREELVQIESAGGRPNAKSRGLLRELDRLREAAFPGMPLLIDSIAILTERTGLAPVTRFGIPVFRARALNSIESRIRKTAARSVLLDSDTAAYLWSLDDFRRENERAMKDLDITNPGNLPPSAWAVVNKRHQDSTVGAAEAAGVDLIRTHRQGPAMLLHPQWGLVDGPGQASRGQAEATLGSHLLLYLPGGVKSKTGPAWSRELVVITDPAGRVTGSYRELPQMRANRDGEKQGLEDLVELLYDLLAPSLREILPALDEDREAWQTLQEERDVWDEAKAGASSIAADRNVESVKLLLASLGIGQDEESKLIRMMALEGKFGVSSVEALRDLPAVMFETLEPLRRTIEALKEERRQVLLTCEEINLWLLEAFEGSGSVAKGKRRQKLLEFFGVDDIEKLCKLPLLTLRRQQKAMLTPPEIGLQEEVGGA